MAPVSRLQSYILIGRLIRHDLDPLAVRWTHEHVKVSSMFEDCHDYGVRVHRITLLIVLLIIVLLILTVAEDEGVGSV